MYHYIFKTSALIGRGFLFICTMRKKILFSGILSMIVLLALRWQGAAFYSSQYPLGIIDFELMHNLKDAKMIIDIVGKRTMQLNVTIDFVFIICYSLFFFFCCKALMDQFHFRYLKTIGFIFLELSVLIGILDLIENIALLITLGGYGSDVSVLISKWAAICKFSLAALVVIYIITASVMVQIISKKKV
jgi:hypothetical protein